MCCPPMVQRLDVVPVHASCPIVLTAVIVVGKKIIHAGTVIRIMYDTGLNQLK